MASRGLRGGNKMHISGQKPKGQRGGCEMGERGREGEWVILKH